MAGDLNNLARLLQDTNRLGEAEPMMARALGIFSAFGRKTGHEHPHFRAMEANFRRLLNEMGLSEAQIEARVREILAGEA